MLIILAISQVTAKAIQRLCPTVDVDQAISGGSGARGSRVISAEASDEEDHDQSQEQQHDQLLLIVTFQNKEYGSIPLLEVIYRHHFQNILYCGEFEFTI